MNPTHEFIVKMAIAAIVFLAIGPAVYVVGKLLLFQLIGQTLAVVLAGSFGLGAWVLIASWAKRQADDWWKHVQ